MRYLLQFPAGATALVRRALAADCADARVRHADDSALVFDSATRLRTADRLGYAKNAFLVHAATPRRALPAALASLAAALPRVRPSGDDRGRGFRLRYHLDGRLVAVERRAGRALEAAVARATGLRLARRGGGHEYWVVGRRGWPLLYLAERLPRRETGPPAPGALSPELSTLLVAASEPAPRDVFLDPFAGSGALVAVRLRTPAHRVIYNDLHPPRRLPATLADHGRVVLHTEDARSLPSIRTGSVDAIVTDPPWGEHDRDLGDYAAFAGALSTSFARVLRPATGRAVVLVNRRHETTLATALTAASLAVLDRYPLLVNGHPASALRARR